MSGDKNEVEIAVKRKTVRFTIDFDAEQHRFLKLFSLESGVQAALIVRALVYLLEISENVANAVIDEIFGTEDDAESPAPVLPIKVTAPVENHKSQVEFAVKRKTVRFTIDFDAEQHRFLKLFSLESGVQAALVIRALVYLLEISEDIANAVIDEIFGDGQEVEV